MDYQDLIENNEDLQRFFIKFPKKLHKLAREGNDFLKFLNNTTLIMDYIQFGNYLMSSRNVFKLRSIMDFLETLQVLQFNRGAKPKIENCFTFINPNFSADQAVSDDFYRQAIDITNINALKGTKRMLSLHYINLFNRLLRLFKRNEIKITKLEYARLRLKFSLQSRLDLMRYEVDTVDHNIAEPEYVKNKEVAGYYGNVDLKILTKVFGDYFPIYQQEAAESSSQHGFTLMPEDVLVDVESVPVIKSAPVKQTPIVEQNTDSNKENEPPTKRRRYTKKSQKITNKETNSALMNLQKEFSNFNTI